MLNSIEGNFDNPKVHELLTKHFIELRAASPEGSAHVLDIAGIKDPSIKFWSLWKNKNNAMKTRTGITITFSLASRKLAIRGINAIIATLTM